MLKACLNGARGRDEHPSVPVTPADLAADAARCARLGAGGVHEHPPGADGRVCLLPAVFSAARVAFRAGS
ncbi:3-keto-5-aminohexanoate cleavage protein, partial [Micromonospora sp. NPDC052213]|uniref:3-keto-5-aminohexanoate cleavage protein n=1 Tax=Micromonospora sp. NPDC052213 TaxID=3155812 RepID=UPI00342B31AE